MSLNIGDNFKYLGKKFLDNRESFNTLEEMNACNDVPKGFITICYEDDTRYEFDGTEWVEYAGGGGGGSTQGGTLSTTLPEYNTISEGDKVNIPYTFTSPNYGEAKLYVTIVNGEASRELEYPIIRQGGGNVSLGTLNRGVNYITMYAVDALAKMTNIVNITIVCGALDINSTFDDGQDYSIYSNISIPINVNALDPNDTMMLHYNIDGNEATMQVYNGFNTFVFPADYKTVGVHIVTLQVIGTGFQSNILEYNIVVCDNTHILLSTKSLEVSIEEGYNVELEYRVSTTNVADYSVVYTLNSIEYLRSKAIVGKNKFTGNFKDFPLGDHVLGIVVSSSDGLLTASLNITIHVVPNSFKRIEHATIGLEAYFDMSRNNNNSLTKNELLSVVPTSAGSTAKLVLHDYNYATNGWINGRLVSNGKAWAEMVDYLPLEDDAINGFTFDILFRSDNMGDNYANVIECTGVDSPYMGFAIDSEKAMLTTEVNKLNTYYTDKEDMRITFIVNRTSTYYEEYIKDPETGWSIKNPNPTYKPNPMVQTFVNGIFTDVAMLSDAGSGNNKIYEHIQNTSQLLINTDKNKTAFGNSSIKSIRIYSRPLDHEEVLQNYMADIDDLMEQKAVYDKNYVTVDQDLPTLNFYDTEIGKCDLMTKDTKQWINVVYTSPNPKLFGESFNLMGQTSWQGTSSLAYPTKNYKFKLYDWARDANGDIIEASKWDKSTYTKKKINMYPSEPNGKKENTYCLKADYMDSSHCRNTGTARLVNDFLFDGHPNPAKQVDPQTRDTINGFPCNLYINGRWMGVFNFNHDKSCTKTLGMETIPNTVRWEIKANSDSSAGAFIKTWTNKEECYQAINTDFEIVYDEDAFEGKTGSYDVTKYYDELGFAHEGTVMGTYYDYAILSLARFVNFVSGADEATWKAHISEYCDVEQACRYYLNVMTMGMIDNFAKNCIINMYGDDIWWFSFYDMDSSLGLDNTGYNKFDSNIEPNQPGVYNCSTSRMWVKLNDYSQDDLFNTFKTIREGKYTYENICKYLIEKQIDVIPQLLYNKDMYQKYISQGRQYLHMLHGNNKDHLKRWLYNRFQYVDSLFLQHNSPYTKQSITIRSCAPANAVPKTDSEGNIISPYTARFEIQTYVPQYITVCWRKNTFETKRVNWNETVVFENDMVNSQDNELIVYCANNLKHLGDISGLNPTSIDIGNATRLIEFTCEDSDKLVKADLSKNSFLKRASFRGCSVMGTASGGSNVLDVTGCTNLKELDIRGTQITSLLTNTEGGNLEKILYPEAIQNIVLSNQINLEVIGLPLDVERDIYAKNLSSVTILNCENVKALSYPYKEGEPVNFNSLKYVQNLTLSNSIPSLTELSFDGFSKLRNINVYTMPQITSIKFTDLLPATETSTFKTLTLANIPQVDTVSFNVTSDDYKIAFADGAKVDLGNLTSCHTIESNYSIKGLNTLILPITVRNLRFTTEYGDGINDITNIWSHNCNHEGDGFTGLDFADMSIDYIDMTGLSKVTSGINFNLSPIEHNPNLNNGRDGSAEKPYFRPTGTLNLDNYTGDMTNMLKGVDLSKLEVILNANKTQTDLSYLFYGAIGTNTDVVDRILGRFPNSTVWDYMFATSDRNTDIDLPLRLTSVIGTFKNTAISEYLENWNKTYDNSITATDCYTGTSGVLSEIPVSWGGYGLDKNVTSIYVIDTTHLTNTTTFNLVLQDNQAGITDWGDGVTNSEKSHTYAEHGVYTIKTKSWSNGTPSDDLKNALIEVKQIKLIGHNGNSKDYSNAFNGCNKLRKVTAYDLAPTNCQNMFYNCTSLTEIVGLDTWDMSNCNSISGAFQSCTSLTTIPTIPNGVTDMNSTFRDCSSLTSVPNIPNSVTNMNSTFYGCTSLTTIPNMPNSVTNMYFTFCNCSSLTSVPNISNSVTDMTGTFFNCTSLTSVPTIPNSVTSMDRTFRNCVLLTEVNLSNRDFNNITSFADIFNNCTGLTRVTLNNITDTSTRESGVGLRGALNTLPQPVEIVMDEITMTDFSNLFQGVTKIKNDIIFPTNTTNVSNCFKDCTSMTHIHSNWKTEYTAMENTTDCYAGCTGITHCDGVDLGINEYIAGLDEVPVAWGGYGFSKDVTSIIVVEIPSNNYEMNVCAYPQYSLLSTKTINWGDGTITTGTNIHTYATAGTYTIKGHVGFGYYAPAGQITDCLIEVKQMSTVTNLREPNSFDSSFNNCIKLTKVTAYNLTPTKCVNMFKNCSSLTEIVGMETWDMSNCTSYASFLHNCSSITYDTLLQLSNVLDFRNCVKNSSSLENMFNGVTFNDAVPLQRLNVSSIRSARGMLCSIKVNGDLDLSMWDMHPTNLYDFMSGAIINGAVNLSGWDVSNCTDFSRILHWANASSVNLSGWNFSSGTTGNYPFIGCPASDWDFTGASGIKFNIVMNNPQNHSANSLVGLFNALYDFASEGNADTHSCEIGTTNLAKLTNEQKMIVVNKGWKLEGYPVIKITSSINLSSLTADNSITKAYIELTQDNVATRMSEVMTAYPNITELYFYENGSVTSLDGLFTSLDITVKSQFTKIVFMSGHFNNVSDLSDSIREVDSLDEIPTAWGGYGFDKFSTLIMKIDTTKGGSLECTLFWSNQPNRDDMITDWGDGTIDSEFTHTYAEHGIYRIKTKAYNTNPVSMSGCNFVIEVENIPPYKTNCNYFFDGCTNLVRVTTYNLTLTNAKQMFYKCTNLTEIVGMETWDMSNCTEFNQMFANTRALTDLSAVNSWNLSKLTNFHTMLAGSMVSTASLTFTQDLSHATNTRELFNGFNGASLDTSQAHIPANNMSYMFNYARNLVTADLRGFDTSTATNYTGIFNSCSNLITLDCSTWDVSRAETLTTFSELRNVTNFKAPMNISANFTCTSSNLTVESLMSIINNLTTVSTARTLTIGSTNLAKLLDEQIAIATNKGWTLQ